MKVKKFIGGKEMRTRAGRKLSRKGVKGVGGVTSEGGRKEGETGRDRQAGAFVCATVSGGVESRANVVKSRALEGGGSRDLGCSLDGLMRIL